MEPRHRKLNDDELEDAEYIEEHNDDDEMMLTLPSVAQNGIQNVILMKKNDFMSQIYLRLLQLHTNVIKSTFKSYY